jgi:hypothetical protein
MPFLAIKSLGNHADIINSLEVYSFSYLDFTAPQVFAVVLPCGSIRSNARLALTEEICMARMARKN